MRSEKYLVVISWITLGTALVIWLFPIIWFVLASLKTPKDMYDIASFNLSPYNFLRVFQNYPIGLYMRNSLILAFGSGVIAVTVGTLTAYGISHTKFRFKNPTTIFIFLVRLVPSMAVMVPLFLIFSSLGLTNTFHGLILAHAVSALPLVVIIMLGYFSDFPKELVDAAYIDGCNRFNVIYLIVIPIVKPGLTVVSIFAFIVSWNNFDISLLLGYLPQYKTMPLGLAMMNTQYGILWNLIAAAGALYILPTIILAIALQRYVVRGLTAGAIKG